MVDKKKKKTDPKINPVAMSLLGMVEYTKGGVTSKTLVDNEFGTITIFSFDADQGLSEHKAPAEAFIQVLEGHLEMIVEGKPVKIEAGEIFDLKANATHSLKATMPTKMLLMMIRT